MDCGYKKLFVTSENQILGKDLESKIVKISRKKQGSKGFKRALAERNDYINKEIKQLNLSTIKDVVVEDLKNVKHNSKSKIRKEFMNKLQRWIYAKALNRLEMNCEVGGVHCHRINPAYSSQECSSCHYIHRSNRISELFKCGRCGHTSDADYNASLNILSRFRPQEPTDPVQESC